MAGRRSLSFDTLDRVMPDVDRLLAGHTTVGSWSLGQICNHLTAAVIGSVEGFPVRAPWLLRNTLGRLKRRQILRTGTMPAGVNLPERFLPRAGLDARAEAEALRAALQFYAASTGPTALHPFFDRLSREEWTRLHCIHCAHHLSFVLPAGVAEHRRIPAAEPFQMPVIRANLS
jgi:hypothetical protein